MYTAVSLETTKSSHARAFSALELLNGQDRPVRQRRTETATETETSVRLWPMKSAVLTLNELVLPGQALAVPHHPWPAGDPVLAGFENEAWRDCTREPMLCASFERSFATRVLGRHGYSFLVDAPKMALRIFQHHSTATDGHAAGDGGRRVEGAVFFTPEACGPPHCAHGGAIFTALDSLLPAALRLSTGRITFTQELTVDLVRFVPVGAVLRFELTALELRSSSDGSKQDYYVVTGALLSGGGASASSASASSPATVHARATGSFVPIREGTEARRSYERAVVLAASALQVTPPTLHRLPPPLPLSPALDRTARAAFDALAARVRAGELEPIDVHADFPVMAGSLPAGHRPFEDGENAKLRTALWWEPSERTVHGLVYFSGYAEGPPGRTHGGAIATAFDNCLGCTCVRGDRMGANTTQLSVAFRRALPLRTVVRFRGRVLDGDGEESGRPISITGELFDLEDEGVVFATARSQWRRPRHLRGTTYEEAMHTWGRKSKVALDDLRAMVATQIEERKKVNVDAAPAPPRPKL